MTAVLLAVPPFVVAYALLAICTLLVLIADRALPHARVGNCWSYTGARWARFGGFIGIRAAPGARFFGFLPVPHAIWIRDLRDADILQTTPLQRKRSRFFPWYVFYFKFKVTSKESKPARTDWAELSDSTQ